LTPPETRACEEKRDMTDMKRLPGFRAIAMAVAVVCSACAGDSPTQPSAPSAVAAAEATPGTARAQGVGNSPPTLVWKTTPRADLDALPYPTVTGVAPLTVKFNLCPSTDPEQVTLPDGTFDPNGDFINWQFHFGDSAEPAFDEDGHFKPDFDHFCRVEHVYPDAGQYTATLNVTDRHVSDASREVGSLASVFTRVTINVLGSAPSDAGPVILSFEAEPVECDDIRFSWTTSGATSVTLDNGIGTFGPNGSATAELSNGTVVTLTAVGPNGTATAQVTVVEMSCP
jgi:hypothetical protein